MTTLFLSYSRQDEKIVQEIYLEFQNDPRFTFWFDRVDIPAGSIWNKEIKKGLDACTSLIVIVSQYSMASEFVKDEWKYFLQTLEKPVYLWQIDNCVLDPELNALPLSDFRADPFDKTKWFKAIDYAIGLIPEEIDSSPKAEASEILPNYVIDRAKRLFWMRFVWLSYLILIGNIAIYESKSNRDIFGDLYALYPHKDAILIGSIIYLLIATWHSNRSRTLTLKRRILWHWMITPNLWGIIFLGTFAQLISGEYWLPWAGVLIVAPLFLANLRLQPREINDRDEFFDYRNFIAKNENTNNPISLNSFPFWKNKSSRTSEKSTFRREKLYGWLPVYRYRKGSQIATSDNPFAYIDSSVLSTSNRIGIFYAAQDTYFKDFILSRAYDLSHVSCIEVTPNSLIDNMLLGHEPFQTIILLVSRYTPKSVEFFDKYVQENRYTNLVIVYMNSPRRLPNILKDYQKILVNWDFPHAALVDITAILLGKKKEFGGSRDDRSSMKNVRLMDVWMGYGILAFVYFMFSCSGLAIEMEGQSQFSIAYKITMLLSLTSIMLTFFSSRRLLTIRIAVAALLSLTVVEIVQLIFIFLVPAQREMFITFFSSMDFLAKNDLYSNYQKIAGVIGFGFIGSVIVFYIYKAFNLDERRKRIMMIENSEVNTYDFMFLIRDVYKPFEWKIFSVLIILNICIFIALLVAIFGSTY